MATMPANTAHTCSPFSCHVDCATSCADDQPFDHKYDHPPSFDEPDDAGIEVTRHEEKGIESSTQGPEAEASSVMRFVLWALNVKTDTGV